MNRQLLKIMVIDPDKEMQRKVERCFKICAVFVAKGKHEAEKILKCNLMDIFIVDVKTPDDLRIASDLQRRYPDSLVCLWTARILEVHGMLSGSFLCIEKRCDEKFILAEILNNWRLKRQKKWQEQLWGEMESNFSANLLQMYFKEVGPNVDALHMRLEENPEVSFLSEACRHPDHMNIVSFYLSLMSGCYGTCQMCGVCRKQPYKLSGKQIAAQWPYLFSSCKAFGYLQPGVKFVARYLCGGDPRYCLKELCEAVEIIDNATSYPVKHVITTTGGVEVLKPLVENLSQHDIALEFSLHSAFPNDRIWLMSHTKHDSLIERTIDFLSDFHENTDQDVAIRQMVIRNFNDTPRQLDQIASLLQGTSLAKRVKVMAMEGVLASYPKITTEHDCLNVVAGLAERGIESRYIENVGKGLTKMGMPIPASDREEFFRAA